MDAGDSYDAQTERARKLSEELAAALKEPIRDGKKIERLRKALDQARYTGD